MKLYRPSNGTEGDWFWSRTCAKCVKRHSCTIYVNALAGKQPRQWVYGDDGDPTCTSLQENRKDTNYRCRKTQDLFRA
jgi:hypothetical protein